MSRVGTAGKKIDLLIKQGATFAIPFAVTDGVGAARNLTGFAVRSQIRKRKSSGTVIANFTATITDYVGGLFVLSLSAAQTAAIAAGESPNDEASKYVWDLEIESPGGEVLPIAYGAVAVHAEVTR